MVKNVKTPVEEMKQVFLSLTSLFPYLKHGNKGINGKQFQDNFSQNLKLLNDFIAVVATARMLFMSVELPYVGVVCFTQAL